MSLYSDLRAVGGIMRSTALLERGHGLHRLRTLVKAGHLIRPQRGWIALPDTDPHLLRAAERGVVLSCVTAIQRLGIWSFEQKGPLHVATRSPNAHLSRGREVVHWAPPVLVRSPATLVDSIENALHYVASCQPYEEAMAIWESALNKQLVTRDALERLPLKRRARKLLEACTPFSDSGLETYVKHRVTALRLPVIAQAWILGHRVDFLVCRRVVLQIDGATHTGAQRDIDNAHDAVLHANGYTVIRVSYHQVVSGWPAVQHRIMLAVSQSRVG